MAPAYDDQQLLRRQERSQRAFHRALADASAGASLLERPGGIQATIVPAAPRIALVNSVFYTSPEAITATLPEVGERYQEAGVQHWGVWVPADDRATARLLRASGHTRRMAPMVMGGELHDVDLSRFGELELEPRPTAGMVGRCNDLAFGVQPPDTLAAPFERDDHTGYRPYVVRRDGELACGLVVRHDEGNLYTWGLAATSAARGPLLALRLMRVVMRDAYRNGCVTVTCETTPDAQAIAQYMHLRPIARLALWERRAGA